MLAVCLCSAATFASDTHVVTGRAMGTTWSVKFIPRDAVSELAIVERAVRERLEELEQLFSIYRPHSAVSLFNAAETTEWFPCAPELAQVAVESRRISALTGGAFDVTVHPLVQLWGFETTRRSNSVPAPGVVALARARVDWRRLEVRISPSALRKTAPRTSVDFSSIAKGFAADAVGELLAQLGAANHLVQIGGDVKAGGSGPRGTGWRVALESPSNDVASAAGVVALTDQAVSTSGDYRNFFTVSGRRYGHIIDPRRGEPVAGALAAVSVVHESSATSSALATALFVLGAEEGMHLAAEHRLACVFVLREGATLVARATPAFERWREER
jgi:thiamine biosynthesis lipoprotein